MSKIFYYISLLLTIIGLIIVTGTFITALGGMGGGSTARWIGNIGLVISIISIQNYIHFMIQNWQFFIENKGKIILLSLLNIAMLLPLWMGIAGFFS